MRVDLLKFARTLVSPEEYLKHEVLHLRSLELSCRTIHFTEYPDQALRPTFLI